jgi:hypothetical protein
MSVKPTFTITTNSFELISLMVTRGAGIACQLRPSEGADPDRPDLIYLPIREQQGGAAVLACAISERGTPSIAVSLCLEELRLVMDRWYAKSLAHKHMTHRSRKLREASR